MLPVAKLNRANMVIVSRAVDEREQRRWKTQFISIKFEAATTRRRLAGLSTLLKLPLSEHLINGQIR